MISQGVVAGKMVTLIFSQTFMNLSGQSVRKYLRYQAKLPQLIVVHDDIDLPVGTVRLSQDRGAGGHNGVEFRINAIGTKILFASVWVLVGILKLLPNMF